MLNIENYQLHDGELLPNKILSGSGAIRNIPKSRII
jgi:hypothetical protein